MMNKSTTPRNKDVCKSNIEQVHYALTRQHIFVYASCKKQSTKPQYGFRLLEINRAKWSWSCNELDVSWQVLQETKCWAMASFQGTWQQPSITDLHLEFPWILHSGWWQSVWDPHIPKIPKTATAAAQLPHQSSNGYFANLQWLADSMERKREQ